MPSKLTQQGWILPLHTSEKLILSCIYTASGNCDFYQFGLWAELIICTTIFNHLGALDFCWSFLSAVNTTIIDVLC